jgi:hypothetical protein
MAWYMCQVSWRCLHIQVILRLLSRQSKRLSAGIINGKDLWSMVLKWPQMAWPIHTKFHNDRFWYSSNIKDITSTICEASMLGWLINGFLKYATEMVSDGMTYIPCPMTIRFRYSSNIVGITSSIWEAIVLLLLTGRIYELCSWDGLRCHDMHVKFHKYWFKHWKVIRGDTHTNTQTVR